MNLNIYDEKVEVETIEAYEAAREVAKTDGILIGTSSGAAIHAATQLAKRPENEGSTEEYMNKRRPAGNHSGRAVLYCAGKTRGSLLICRRERQGK